MNKDDSTIPYIVFESELARSERHIKRLWILVLTLIIVGMIAIGAFVWYISLPVEEVTTQEVSGSDNTDLQMIGGDYNEGETDKNNSQR